MAEDAPNLTAAQELALAELLKGKTQGEAAVAADVRRETVCQWVNHNADFRAEHEAGRKELRRQILAKALAYGGRAVDTLYEIADHGVEERDRIAASKALLDRLGPIADDGSNVQRIVVELAPEVRGQADPQPDPSGPQ